MSQDKQVNASSTKIVSYYGYVHRDLNDDGEFVLHSDYKKLEQQHDELLGALKRYGDCIPECSSRNSADACSCGFLATIESVEKL